MMLQSACLSSACCNDPKHVPWCSISLCIIKSMSQMHMLELATHVCALDIGSHNDAADPPADVYT